MQRINRRKFFAGITTGLLGVGFGKGFSSSSREGSKEEELRIKKYKALGSTGIRASDVICGMSNIFSPNVARYAYDLGINVFDTAENYMNGRSEDLLCQALNDVRKDIIIITKYLFPSVTTNVTKESIYERVNASLKRLRTDYLDFVFIHGIRNLDIFKNEEIIGAFKQMIKQGKIRFTGFSTHDAYKTLKECLKPEYSDFVQAVLFFYNHMEGKEIESLITQLHNKGIGTIAMKSSAGGKQGNLKAFVNDKVSYLQAAAKWVLSNPDIDCCNVSMADFAQVEEFVGISGNTLIRKDLALLGKYRKEVFRDYCRLSCHTCESLCPDKVAISDIMRFAMYFEDYRHEKKAIENYMSLDTKEMPLNCTSCPGHCNKACPFGLKVKEKLLHTHEILMA